MNKLRAWDILQRIVPLVPPNRQDAYFDAIMSLLEGGGERENYTVTRVIMNGVQPALVKLIRDEIQPVRHKCGCRWREPHVMINTPVTGDICPIVFRIKLERLYMRGYELPLTAKQLDHMLYTCVSMANWSERSWEEYDDALRG